MKRLLSLFCGLLCLFAWGCGQQASHVPAPSGPAPAREQSARPKGSASLPAEAMQAYQAARAAVRKGDYAEAGRQLQASVAAKPDFTEAWYNLGASYGMLAIEAAGVGEDSRAIAHFREAVEAKRKAEALIREGKWFLYGPREQEQTIADLQEGLKDADEVMADDRSLLMALRLHALTSR